MSNTNQRLDDTLFTRTLKARDAYVLALENEASDERIQELESQYIEVTLEFFDFVEPVRNGNHG